MNVSLRAVHEALEAAGDPATVWRRFVDAMSQRTDSNNSLGRSALTEAMKSVGVGGSGGEWVAHLVRLGVLDDSGHLDAGRVMSVASALELVGDSFRPLGSISSWFPVATVPLELRRSLHPPVVRQTAGVLLDLLDHALDEVQMAAPFVDRDAVDFLSFSLVGCGHRGVDVTVVTSNGAGVNFHGLAERWRREAAGRLTVAEVTTVLSPLGSHAKVMVVDNERAYVGSANLTSAGFGRHVEIGVEVRGPQVASLSGFLVALQRAGVVIFEVGGPGAARGSFPGSVGS